MKIIKMDPILKKGFNKIFKDLNAKIWYNLNNSKGQFITNPEFADILGLHPLSSLAFKKNNLIPVYRGKDSKRVYYQLQDVIVLIRKLERAQSFSFTKSNSQAESIIVSMGSLQAKSLSESKGRGTF